MGAARIIAAPLLALMAFAAPAADEATVVVRNATEQLQSEIREHRAVYASDHEALYARASELALPAFDVRLASELALGKEWRRATANQRDEFEAAMAQALVRIYALALLEQDGERALDWNRSQMKALDGTTAVSATVHGDAPANALLLFAMRRNAAGSWQVYDVSFKGSSVIDGLRRRGATLPQLLQALRQP